MSYYKHMAYNSFARVNNSLWIGLPKVATTTLNSFFKDYPVTYFNTNAEFLNKVKFEVKPTKLWCVWRDPWERWVSAIIQDFEYKYNLGIVTNGVKNHRILSKEEILTISKDIQDNWNFTHNNLRNKKFSHSSIYLARYITILWRLIQKRCVINDITFYPIDKINNAIKDILNVDTTQKNLNQTNSTNTNNLGTILYNSSFYKKWQLQFAEDLELNNIIKKRKTINFTDWQQKVLFNNQSRYAKVPIKSNQQQ